MLNHTTTHDRTPVAWPFLVIGLALASAAVALLWDDASHRGFKLDHALQPVIVLGAAAAGISAHHSFHSWRLGYGLAFLVVAVLGSGMVVYGSLGRQADAREGRQAEAKSGNDVHTEVKAELTKAKTLRDTECKTGFKDKCTSAQGRVDALLGKLGKSHTVSLDPRAEALGDLAVLLGLDRKRTMDIVAAVDPIALPMWLELGSIVFLGAAFPPTRKRRKSEEIETLAGKCQESVSVAEVLEPLSYSRSDALEDFRAMRTTPNQKALADRWGVAEGTVSKWLTSWESQGLASRGERFGKERAALALPAPSGGNTRLRIGGRWRDLQAS